MRLRWLGPGIGLIVGCSEPTPGFGESEGASTTTLSTSSGPSATVAETPDETSAVATGDDATSTSAATRAETSSSSTEGPSAACLGLDPWWDDAWASRILLELELEEVGGPYDDFVLRVALDPERFAYDTANADGSDLRFVTLGGDALDYEIERWDPEGASEIWVRVDLPDDDSAQLWLYSSNPAAQAPVPSGAVWPPEVVGVWHMQGEADSSQYGHPTQADGGAPARGMIGGAHDFAGHADGFRITPGSELLLNDDVFLTMFVKIAGYVGDPMPLLLLGGDPPAGNGYYGVWISPAGDRVRVGWEHGAGTAEIVNFDLDEPLPLDTWISLAVMRRSQAQEVVLALDEQTLTQPYDAAPSGGTAVSLVLGAGVGDLAGMSLNGALDEVRIESQAIRLPRARLEFDNRTDQLVRYCPAQPRE